MRKIINIGLIALTVIAVLSSCKKEQRTSFSMAKVEKGSIQTSITATGTIEPVTSVTVGTQVSGIVNKLYVDYNSEVKKGQVIAELDKTNLISELNTAKANLSSAQSTLAYEQNNFQRYKTLYDKGLVSADEFETARLSYLKAKDQVTTSSQSVQKAQTNLGYATITSPIDGVVLSKAVEEGQTVAASFNTPELFTIAQDLTNMRVIADIDEADIGGVKEGQRVSFTVDAFPDDNFEATKSHDMYPVLARWITVDETNPKAIVIYAFDTQSQNRIIKITLDAWESRLWAHIDGQRTVGEIAQKIAEEDGAPAADVELQITASLALWSHCTIQAVKMSAQSVKLTSKSRFGIPPYLISTMPFARRTMP